MLNNRMQNLDTKKEISIPKRRLRPPRCHKKDISIPKKDAPSSVALQEADERYKKGEEVEIPVWVLFMIPATPILAGAVVQLAGVIATLNAG